MNFHFQHVCSLGVIMSGDNWFIFSSVSVVRHQPSEMLREQSFITAEKQVQTFPRFLWNTISCCTASVISDNGCSSPGQL